MPFSHLVKLEHSAISNYAWIFSVNSPFGYCYHSVNVISFLLDQSDHIKRLPLYLPMSCLNVFLKYRKGLKSLYNYSKIGLVLSSNQRWEILDLRLLSTKSTERWYFFRCLVKFFYVDFNTSSPTKELFKR